MLTFLWNSNTYYSIQKLSQSFYVSTSSITHDLEYIRFDELAKEAYEALNPNCNPQLLKVEDILTIFQDAYEKRATQNRLLNS